MMKKVIIISGHPGAGKSTAADYLKTKFFGDIINVGDAINQFLVSEDVFIEQREQIGLYFLKYYNENKLFDILKKRIKGKLTILDGLRLFSVYEKFQENNIDSLLFFIDTNPEIRKERLRLRSQNLSDESIENQLEKYNIYSDSISKLKMVSTIIIKNNASLTDFHNTLEREANSFIING